MQRYKGIIEYCGTNYFGMQRQDGLKTVQEAMESALEKFTGGMVKEIDYCGRTDAGVHAFGQVIHFNIPTTRNDDQILKGINFFLNVRKEEVVLKKLEKVDNNFHARFSCKGREYKYYIYNSPTKSPIFTGRMHHVPQKLDVSQMLKVTELLIGEHNFSSFRGKSCQALSPIKTIDFINIIQISQEILEIHVGAKSFLYRMVRNITGLLISIGTGKLELEDIKPIFEKKDISALPYTAPACGLYFFKAWY